MIEESFYKVDDLATRYMFSLKIFCLKTADGACLNIVKDEKNIAKLYCSEEAFEKASKDKAVVEMQGENCSKIRIIPQEYNSFNFRVHEDDLERVLFKSEVISKRVFL